jgi:hypothetical protein
MAYRGGYVAGERVQYSSESSGAWLDAHVEREHRDGTVTLLVRRPGERRETVYPNVSQTRVRRLDRGPESPSPRHGRDTVDRTTTRSGTKYAVGQQIEYASESRDDWVPATVTAIDRRGLLTIRMLNGTEWSGISTTKTRHRSAREIQREIDEERRRAARARRDEQAADRQRARDDRELVVLRREVVRYAAAAPRRRVVARDVGRAHAPRRVVVRNRWLIGERCEVYSNTRRGWFGGHVTRLGTDTVTGVPNITVSYLVRGIKCEKTLAHDDGEVRPRSAAAAREALSRRVR